MDCITHFPPLTRLRIDGFLHFELSTAWQGCPVGSDGCSAGGGIGHALVDEFAEQEGVEICVVVDGGVGRNTGSCLDGGTASWYLRLRN